MNHQDNAPSRTEIEAEIIDQIRREVRETISTFAPAKWTDEKREAVEKAALDYSHYIMDALTMGELLSVRAFDAHLERAVEETKRLILSGGPVVITYT